MRMPFLVCPELGGGAEAYIASHWWVELGCCCSSCGGRYQRSWRQVELVVMDMQEKNGTAMPLRLQRGPAACAVIVPPSATIAKAAACSATMESVCGSGAVPAGLGSLERP
jgi:hypothetical protein